MRNGLVVYQTPVPYQTVAQIVCIKISAALMVITTIPPWLNIFRVHMHQSTTAPQSSRSSQRRSHTAPYTPQSRANTSVLTLGGTDALEHLATFRVHECMAMQSISASNRFLAHTPPSTLALNPFHNRIVQKSMAILILERSLTLAPTPLSTLALNSSPNRTVPKNMAILTLEKSLTHVHLLLSTVALKCFHNQTAPKNMAELISEKIMMRMRIRRAC